jgi:hypothetical protein
MRPYASRGFSIYHSLKEIPSSDHDKSFGRSRPKLVTLGERMDFEKAVSLVGTVTAVSVGTVWPAELEETSVLANQDCTSN